MQIEGEYNVVWHFRLIPDKKNLIINHLTHPNCRDGSRLAADGIKIK